MLKNKSLKEHRMIIVLSGEILDRKEKRINEWMEMKTNEWRERGKVDENNERKQSLIKKSTLKRSNKMNENSKKDA